MAWTEVSTPCRSTPRARAGQSKGVGVTADARKTDETVEVMKRRLRSTLRQARDKAGLTQKDAADQQGWSVSKIVRIELGAVLASPADVRALLSLYGFGDPKLVADMADLAKRAREGKGYAEYADVYSAEALDLFGNESAAKVIYKYEPVLVPGVFQTEDYARAVLFAFKNSQESVERKLEVRLARRQILEGDPRPELNFIISETSVRTPVGGSAVMRHQLDHLCELATQSNISLQLLPFAAGVHLGLGEAFTVLQFDETLEDLLFLEAAAKDTVSRDDPLLISRYLERFAELKQAAAAPEQSVVLLQEIAQAYSAS
jgi:transcriptional regulator with XRE-family HTH domain